MDVGVELRNERLWFAIAGENYRNIPSEGTLVYYLPAVHAMNAGLPVGADFVPMLCRVAGLQLDRTTHSFHIRVRYILVATSGANQAQSLVQIGDPGIVHTKPMSHADCYGYQFVIPVAAANQLFPPDQNQPPGFQDLQVRFMGPIRYTLRLTNRRFSAGWSALREMVLFQEGDRFLITRMSNGELVAGIQRAAPPPFVPNLHTINLARFDLRDGMPIVVDDYPRPGHAPFVVRVEDFNG